MARVNKMSEVTRREERLSRNARPSSQPASPRPFPSRNVKELAVFDTPQRAPVHQNEPAFTHQHNYTTAWTNLTLAPPVPLSELRRL
jgi:hypothetical protein